jgi:transcriptional regulator with XRE-family HTH domain
MDWKEYKQELLKDKNFTREYEALDPEYQVAASLLRLRLKHGLTQEQLAKAINTKQASIARLESGARLPSLSMVRKVADALDADVEIRLRPRRTG